jgi:DNA-binding response OmpR family regulator
MAQRIMVINDTQEILDLFRLLLEEEAGYEVVLYSYAVSDMREITRHAPDLIILDYIFGGETLGWQLLQKLKMNRATAKIPVIICTAATNQVREIEGYMLAHGITLVPKPFDIDDVLDAVKRALEVTPTHDAKLLPERDEARTEEGSDGDGHEEPGTKRG